MKRGIRLLNDARPESIREALTCFDEALELRRQLPLETTPSVTYGLAACWLNRADALMRLEDATQIGMALRAYDEALALLRSLPLSNDSRFPRRYWILSTWSERRPLALLPRRGGSALPSAYRPRSRDAIAVLRSVSRPWRSGSTVRPAGSAWSVMNLAKKGLETSNGLTSHSKSWIGLWRDRCGVGKAIAAARPDSRRKEGPACAEVGLRALSRTPCLRLLAPASLAPAEGEE